MDKLKKAILGKPRWEKSLPSYIILVEENKVLNSNISLDGAKSILESISKTILSDKDIEYKKDESVGNLVKKTFASLPVFAKLSNLETEQSKSILNAFATVSNAVGTFRNEHGVFSHGQDLQSEKFDQYLVDLSIASSDLIASFLIISHSEDLRDRSRVYYEEHDEFNRYIDEIAENMPIVDGYVLSPSQSLYSDVEAYKESLGNFVSEKETLISQIENSENFISTRRICSNLSKYKEFLTDDEVVRVVSSAIDNPDVHLILGHGHTKNLFSWIKKEKAHILRENILKDFEVSFDKAVW